MFKKKSASKGNMPVPQPPKGVTIECNDGVTVFLSYDGHKNVKVTKAEEMKATWMGDDLLLRSMKIKFDKR